MESDTPKPPSGYFYQALNEGVADCEAVTGEKPRYICLSSEMLEDLKSELQALPATPINARLNLTEMTFNGISIVLQEDL